MFSDLFSIILVVGVWYALMRYIFPALGIPTCMSGACQLKPQIKKAIEKEPETHGGEQS
jgi:hypothetical protein